MTLEWAKADVLLILDCCYAAQAARARDGTRKFDILAAAPMHGYTPLPGPRSFTKAVMTVTRTLMAERGHVPVHTLHERLCRREVGLTQTPVTVIKGPRSVTLLPLDPHTSMQGSARSTIPRHPTVTSDREKDPQESLVPVASWLTQEVPPSVSSITVERVIESTKGVSQAVSSLSKEETDQSSPTTKRRWQRILELWFLLKNIITSFFSPSMHINVLDLQERANLLLREIDRANFNVLEALTDVVAQSSEMDEHLKSFMSHLTEEDIQLLKTLLVKRAATTDRKIHGSGCEGGGRKDDGRWNFKEYKRYGPHESARDVATLKEYAAELAKMLSKETPLEFLTLPFSDYIHHAKEHYFVFNFDIPSIYKAKWVTLYDIITKGEIRDNPTLEERLSMAHGLATAVYNWHIANWVHQGINSHDIIFFQKKNTSKWDYSRPFVGGFDYARPLHARSIGRQVQNLRDDVYRHPERLSPRVGRPPHRRSHDVYSLGVVLLELGVWDAACNIANPENQATLTIRDMHRRLTSAVGNNLAFKVGSRYRDAVDICLRSDKLTPRANVNDPDDFSFSQKFKFDVVDKLAEGVKIPS